MYLFIYYVFASSEDLFILLQGLHFKQVKKRYACVERNKKL